MNKKLRVCYYGSYDWNEPHNSTHILGMRQAGIEVVECNLPAASKRDAANNYKGLWRTLTFGLAFLKNGISLCAKLFRLPELDAVIVGYPGFFDVPFAKLYTKRKRIPLIFNVHISLYETLVVDRGYVEAHSLQGKLLKWYDRFLFRLSDTVLTDTLAHAEYFAQRYNLPLEKFRRVFIGADPLFRPQQKRPSRDCTVLFYGTFIPLQGIEYIVQAAHLLRNEKALRFEIIGRGQTKAEIIRLAQGLNVTNITFIDWVSREELVDRIAQADICLGGQFGVTPKAELVIGYKCFQMIAMGKAVIVSDSPGNRELLQHEKNCVMCPAGNAEALAEMIRYLKNNEALRRRIAEESRRTFEEHCNLNRIGEEISRIAMSVTPETAADFTDNAAAARTAQASLNA